MLQFALNLMEQTPDSVSPSGDPPAGGPPYGGQFPAHLSPVTGPALGDRLRGGLWPDALVLAVLALAVVIFFWPVISGRAWLPKGGGDSVAYLFPMYRFAADSLRAGALPFWNPYQYAGTPFVADNQSGLFYPFNLLLFFLWPGFSYRGIELLVIGHFIWAGIAAYICLRLLRPAAPIRRPAALLGALAFMFSDVFITHIGNLNLIAVAAWLPLAFLGLHRAILAGSSRPRLLWAAGGGAALGLATLAGHGQMTFLIAVFLGSYALYQTLVSRRLWALPLLALLGAVGVALAGVALFPAADTLAHTLRADFDYQNSVSFSLPLRGLAGLVAPDFFGRGAAFWGDWPRVEAGYGGVLTLFLAAAAVVLRPNRQTVFFTVAGLFFLLLALGPDTPLYPLLARSLPFIPFQAPARFVLLLNFCLAVLAALGLDALLAGEHQSARRRRGLLAGAGLAVLAVVSLLVLRRGELSAVEPERAGQMARAIGVFAALSAAGWLLLLVGFSRRLPPNVLATAAVLLLFIDLYGLGRYVEIDWNDPTPGFAAGSPALAFLRADGGIDRLDIATGAWQPNVPMIERLYAARGVYNPLQLANYNVYMGSVGYRGSPLYNVLGIKYVIGGKGEPPGDTAFIVPVFDDDPAVTVYLNIRALPRAMVLYNSDVVTDHDAAFTAIHSQEFDPSQTVVLEGGRALSGPPGAAVVEAAHYEPNEVAFNVTTDRPAYFFLSDVYHPDWRAAVDGAPAPIEVANYAFRAVYVEPGRHLITMRYTPSGWNAGVIATAAAVVALLALLIQSIRSRGPANTEPAQSAPVAGPE